MTSSPVHERPGERSIPRVHKPAISGVSTALVLLWLFGLVAGVLGPLLIINAGSADATSSVSAGTLWAAMSTTMASLVVVVLACVLLYRRHRDAGIIVMAIVPFASLFVGGLAIVGAKAPF
jgi:hypothetical protein